MWFSVTLHGTEIVHTVDIAFIMPYSQTFCILGNEKTFSSCTLKSMKTMLDDLHSINGNCFRDLEYADGFPELSVSFCGNGLVEDGEECDCGLNATECNDPCCYPAIISDYERGRNESALSCSRTARSQCLTRPGMVYGFYVPWAVIICAVILISLILKRDWSSKRALFSHITKNNIRIVK